MAKVCAKGKAAAKRKFKVYPSAYANMYASGVCSGCIKPKSKKKRKYPKCVPLAKAKSMTKSEKTSAVKRKRAANNTGPKPKNVSTSSKKKRK